MTWISIAMRSPLQYCMFPCRSSRFTPRDMISTIRAWINHSIPNSYIRNNRVYFSKPPPMNQTMFFLQGPLRYYLPQDMSSSITIYIQSTRKILEWYQSRIIVNHLWMPTNNMLTIYKTPRVTSIVTFWRCYSQVHWVKAVIHSSWVHWLLMIFPFPQKNRWRFMLIKNS